MISSKFKSNTNSNKIILLSLIDTHANYGLLNKVFIFIFIYLSTLTIFLRSPLVIYLNSWWCGDKILKSPW